MREGPKDGAVSSTTAAYCCSLDSGPPENSATACCIPRHLGLVVDEIFVSNYSHPLHFALLRTMCGYMQISTAFVTHFEFSRGIVLVDAARRRARNEGARKAYTAVSENDTAPRVSFISGADGRVAEEHRDWVPGRPRPTPPHLTGLSSHLSAASTTNHRR